MSTALSIDIPTAERLTFKFSSLTAPIHMDHLLDIVGATVASQTVKRFTTKKSPEGDQWVDWSPDYAGSKHGAKRHHKHPDSLNSFENHTLLMLFGHLVESITHVVHSGYVEVGSNLEYAAAQNFGGDGISARPFLGINDDDRDQIDNVITDYLATLL